MLLTLLIGLPILGGLLALLVGRRAPVGAERMGLALSALVFLLALYVLITFRLGVAGLQQEVVAPWVPALGISYHIGVDGLSVLLVFTTALTGLIALAAGFMLRQDRLGDYAGLVLLLQGTVTGAFLALDLILFFAFWEAMLIPMYLLVGMLGGPRRIHAALKFFLYTTVGSLLMLIGILYLYFWHQSLGGTPTFDLPALVQAPLPPGAQLFIFLTFAFAFAIKVPVFPLHTWLPDLYPQAPLPALVLGTILVKVGGYAFLRFCLPLFPRATVDAAPILATLGVLGILYGGLLAVMQRDMLRLLAYSSLAHLGFVVLGIFSLDVRGVQGAIIAMVNHSITAGALFLIAAMLVRRTDTTAIEAMRGLAGPYPRLAAFFLVSLFAALGLPGLNAFVGEILVIIGSFAVYPPLAVLAAAGTILSAVYLLWWYRRVMNGHPVRPEDTSDPPATDPPAASRATARVAAHARAAPVGGFPRAPLRGRDLTGREVAVLVPLVGLMFVIGLYPAPFLATSDATVSALLRNTRLAAVAEPTGTAALPWPSPLPAWPVPATDPPAASDPPDVSRATARVATARVATAREATAPVDGAQPLRHDLPATENER